MIPTTDAPPPCHTNPKLFHTPRGEGATGNDRKRRVNAAKALCNTCPVKAACRDHGRQTGEPGIWGGETEQERAAARRTLAGLVAEAERRTQAA